MTVRDLSAVAATFRLSSPAVAVRVWGWADTSLSWSGYFAQATGSGISLGRVDDGTEVLLASGPATLSAGTTYVLTVSLYQIGVDGYTAAVYAAADPSTPLASVQIDPVTEKPDRWWGVSAHGAAGQSVEFDSVTPAGFGYLD